MKLLYESGFPALTQTGCQGSTEPFFAADNCRKPLSVRNYGSLFLLLVFVSVCLTLFHYFYLLVFLLEPAGLSNSFIIIKFMAILNNVFCQIPQVFLNLMTFCKRNFIQIGPIQDYLINIYRYKLEYTIIFGVV